MLAAGLRGLPGRAALLGRGAPSLVPSRGRKTRRDPPAKSKADRIKVPPPVDPAELLVVLDRYEQHRRVVGALRFEMMEEIKHKNYDFMFGETAKKRNKAEQEEHQGLMALNDAENKRLLERRLERLREEEIQEKARKLQSDENRVSLREKSLKEKEMEVLRLQQTQLPKQLVRQRSDAKTHVTSPVSLAMVSSAQDLIEMLSKQRAGWTRDHFSLQRPFSTDDSFSDCSKLQRHQRKAA